MGSSHRACCRFFRGAFTAECAEIRQMHDNVCKKCLDNRIGSGILKLEALPIINFVNQKYCAAAGGGK